MAQCVLDLEAVAGGGGAQPVAPRSRDDWQAALTLAQAAEAAPDGLAGGREAAAWWRLALLRSFVTPLPHADASHLPLRVLPPPGLRLCNPVQALQWRVTQALARPGGVARLRPLAAALPHAGLRLDFHRFVSVLLPRILEAQGRAAAEAPASVLEAAWADERVGRRWAHFASQLDAEGAAALVRAALRPRPAPRRTARAGDNRRSAKETRAWPSTSSTTLRRSSALAPGWPTVPA